MMMRGNGSPTAGNPPTCGACPAFQDNLCHVFTEATFADALANTTIDDHFAPARRSLWRAGDSLERVPVICQGWAAASATLSDGRRQILSFLLPGDLVSAALIFDPVSHYAVDAVTDLRYRAFPRAELKQAISRKPNLLAIVSRMSAEESARADRLAIDLGRRGAAARIASLMLALAERLRKRGMMPDKTMDFPLRQHHIADAVGLTVVHVGNVIAEFRRAGLLEINERSLTIVDQQGLSRIADEL
jgi:CRP-like cAMP-binding protein